MRLFTAIEIPEPLREDLALMMGGIPGARWISEENLHLTIRFIGDVDRHTAQDIDDALSAISARPFSLTLKSVGFFGDPPRTLWTGLEKSDALLHLVEKVDSCLTRLRIDFEKRRYAPHVTLARLRDPSPEHLRAYLNEYGGYRSDPFPVTRLTLFSSMRSHSGSSYTPERYYVF